MLIRVFTPARKVRRLIGKWGDGKTIPLGPYQLSQVTAAAVGFAVLMFAEKLISVWSFTIIVPLTAITVFALAFVPETQIPLHRRAGYELRYQLRRHPHLVGQANLAAPVDAPPRFVAATAVPVLSTTPSQEHTDR